MNKADKQVIVQKRMEVLTMSDNLNDLVRAGSESFIEAASGDMVQTLSLAIAVTEIEKAITPAVMKAIMSLQGKSIGFKTDKDKTGGYSDAEVKVCMIEAMLLGVPMAGNCMNILANRCYVTREGFTYRINKYQEQGNISQFKFIIQPPFDHEVRGKTSRGNDIIYASVKG